MNLRLPVTFLARLSKGIVEVLKRAGRAGSGKEARRQTTQTVVVCAAFVLLDGALDFLTGPYISFSIVYLLPVGLSTWLVSRRVGFIFAAASALIGLCCDLSWSGLPSASAAVFNCLMRFGVFTILVFLLAALRNQTWQLNKAVEARTEELRKEIAERRRIEREVFQVIQEQKQEMAHELHDGLAQSLTAIAMNTKRLEEELETVFSPQAEAALDIVKSLNAAVGQTRQIARGLSPTTIGANEFISAVTHFALETENAFGLRCRVKTDLVRLPLRVDVGIHLYRIVQQATDNAIRHGKAKNIEIVIENRERDFELAVVDDGVGFADADRPHSGLGLRTMRFRADLLGAHLCVSSAPDQGSRVEIKGSLTDFEFSRSSGSNERTFTPAPIDA